MNREFRRRMMLSGRPRIVRHQVVDTNVKGRPVVAGAFYLPEAERDYFQRIGETVVLQRLAAESAASQPSGSRGSMGVMRFFFL